jgi:hypothetical protein
VQAFAALPRSDVRHVLEQVKGHAQVVVNHGFLSNRVQCRHVRLWPATLPKRHGGGKLYLTMKLPPHYDTFAEFSYSSVLITRGTNEEAFFRGRIRSTIAQTTRPIGWVIVDDGSTDRTAGMSKG